MNRTHPLYRVWTGMRARCYQPNSSSYPNYGARGITVCERWDDFNTFIADMGERPDGCSLDRINNNEGYSPDNCRWASRIQQNRNRRFDWLTNTIAVKPNGTYSVKVRIAGERHQQTCDSLDEAELLQAALIFERDFYKKIGIYDKL